MIYVIWCAERRQYVAKIGSKNSYTDKLQNARTYPTRAAAVEDACDNEKPLLLEEAIS